MWGKKTLFYFFVKTTLEEVFLKLAESAKVEETLSASGGEGKNQTLWDQLKLKLNLA